MSGEYDGTYDETDNETLFCFNIGSLAFSGSSSVSIIQAGNAVVGWIALEDTQDIASNGAGGCVVVDTGEEVLPLYGMISGTTLTLTLPIGGGASDLFTVNFAGADKLTGTVTDSFGDLLAFDGARAAPTVLPPSGPRRRAVRP